MLWCLWWCSPLKVRLLGRRKEWLRSWHVRRFGAEHPKGKVVDEDANRHDQDDKDLRCKGQQAAGINEIQMDRRTIAL